MTNKERYHALEDFANFVAGEIFDPDWNYNCTESFPELACRKLLKLEMIGANEENYVFFNTRPNKNGGESWVLSEMRRKNDNIISDMEIYSDMKLIKDAINDPNKNEFDIRGLIKSIKDKYDLKEIQK